MKDRYSYSDFTEKNYRRLLELGKENGYEFISYQEAENHGGKFVILRHDVDFSPHRALALARAENELGIRTTYCVQLGSYFYNAFEQEIRDIFLEVKRLKHHIGLHFDAVPHHPKSLDELERCISYEKEILERLLESDTYVFSFHNPRRKDLSLGKSNVCGLINAYDRVFIKGMKYISDSNGYWRHERLKDALSSERYERLHVLIHPVWWQEKVMSPWERIQRCINGRKNFTQDTYCEILRKSERKNIGYDKS